MKLSKNPWGYRFEFFNLFHLNKACYTTPEKRIVIMYDLRFGSHSFSYTYDIPFDHPKAFKLIKKATYLPATIVGTK